MASTTDLLDQTNIHRLNHLSEEVPALFGHLVVILRYEQSCRSLPQDVADLVRRLVTVRNQLFQNATPRSASNYIGWPDRDKEHPSMFYPQWPLYRYPKEYSVRYKTPHSLQFPKGLLQDYLLSSPGPKPLVTHPLCPTLNKS